MKKTDAQFNERCIGQEKKYGECSSAKKKKTAPLQPETPPQGEDFETKKKTLTQSKMQKSIQRKSRETVLKGTGAPQNHLTSKIGNQFGRPRWGNKKKGRTFDLRAKKSMPIGRKKRQAQETERKEGLRLYNPRRGE